MKRPLADMLAAAQAFGRLLPREAFERWQFAGSIRRKSPLVKDCEHVVIPAWGDVRGDGLFAESQRVNLLWHALDRLLADGVIERAFVNGSPRWGERYRKVIYPIADGVVHDVFLADADNWGMQFAIRTGGAAFSRELVTRLQDGPHFCHGGHVLDKRQARCGGCCHRFEVAGFCRHTGKGWQRDKDDASDLMPCPNCGGTAAITFARVPVPDERAFFSLCGVPWRPPEERSER